MQALFNLPNELILSSMCARFPCRDQQIRSLATLLSVGAAPTRNIVVHGLEATGKSTITKAVLESLSSPSQAIAQPQHSEGLRYTIVKSFECIGGRHLLEQTVGSVAEALGLPGSVGRCENIPQLYVELEKLLERSAAVTHGRRLVLVFDGIDNQRDAPPTLLPALARLGEVIPSITSVFIVTASPPSFLHFPGAPHIHFPAYSKEELLRILSFHDPQPQLPGGITETKEIWNRFCAAIWESLSKHSGRDVISFRSSCLRIWPRFITPILDESIPAVPFGRLMNINKALFQSDTSLIPRLIPDRPILSKSSTQGQAKGKQEGIGAQLPYYSRIVLVAAYLASFNPPRTDQLLFMRSAAAKRRKKEGGTALTKGRPGVAKHRKISRKLLGPQAFVLERMLAIFHAIKEDANSKGRSGAGRDVTAGAADVQMAIATLASLRLLVKIGAANAADTLDGGSKYRVAVGWEVVRGIARGVGIEAEDYLAE